MKYLYYLLMLLSLNACTDVIDFQLEDSGKVYAIDCFLTTEAKTQYVFIEQSSSYYDATGGKKISGAVVHLLEGNNTIQLIEQEAGAYATPVSFLAQIGKTYTLEVEIEGEIYSATSTIQSSPTMDSIQIVQPLDTIPVIGEIDSSFRILGFTQEPPGIGDHYLWKYHINGVLVSDSLSEYAFVDDTFVDGLYINGFPIYSIEANELNLGDTVQLDMHRISKKYYDFLNEVLLQTEFNGGLFSGPPANVSSNFNSKQVVGFFEAVDVSKSYARIIE